MTEFKHKLNTGSIFPNKNEYKEPNNKPNHYGIANIGDVEYKIAGWDKKTKSGTPYISLSIQKKEDRNDNI